MNGSQIHVLLYLVATDISDASVLTDEESRFILARLTTGLPYRGLLSYLTNFKPGGG